MISPREVVQILLAPLQEGSMCKTTPRAIQHNVTFLVDRKHLKHEDDIKSDDMGAWRNNGVHKYRFAMDEEGDLYQLDEDDITGVKLGYISSKTIILQEQILSRSQEALLRHSG